MFATFLGWLGGCVSWFSLSPGVPSTSNTLKLIFTLGETSKNGIPLGSFQPCILPVYFLHFQQEACVHVCLSLVLSCFVNFPSWLGRCLSCPFLFPNGIPLGSLLEVFSALHSSFLFPPSSFHQNTCIYFLSAVVCGTLRGK